MSTRERAKSDFLSVKAAIRPLALTLVTTALCFSAAPKSSADVLTFMAQNNYDWFSVSNWFRGNSVSGYVRAGVLPVPGDTAIIIGGCNAAANTITLNALQLANNAGVSGGGFYVSSVTMAPGSGFTGSTVNVNSQMSVSGAVGIAGVALTIEAGATLTINAGGTLEWGGSSIYNVGQISLAPLGTGLSGGTNLVNYPNAVIEAATNSIISGLGRFDNQGTVRSDAGTLTIGGFSEWTSSTGTGRFQTVNSNAVINFSSPPTVPAGVTFYFMGPGTSIWANGAQVVGVAQVGLADTNSGQFFPGTLEMDGEASSNGVIHVLGTSLGGSTLNCVNNSILAGPTLDIDPNAQMNVLNGFDALNSVVNNSGTLTWKKGDVDLPGSVFNNFAGALFDCEITNSSTDGNIGAFGFEGGTFNNLGTFRKSIGAHGVVVYGHGPAFINSGLVDARSGYVELGRGTSSGTFKMAPGAEVWFGGSAGDTNTLLASVQFIGTNFVRVVEFVDLFLAGPVTVDNLSLQDSAMIDGPANLTVTNQFLLTSGLLQGSGTLSIPAGAQLNVQGSGSPSINQRTVNNSGTILIGANGGYGLGLGAGALVNNLAPGVIDCISNYGIGDDGTPPRGALVNRGTFLRSGGLGGAPLYLNVTNYAVAQFLTGSTTLFNYQQLAGATYLAANASVSIGTPLNLQGGLLYGLGTVNGPVSNAAVVMPASPPGPLSVGAYVQNQAGVLNVILGGATVGQYSQVISPGGPALAGTLNVMLTNGFIPSPGQTFYVVQGNYPISGSFSAVTGAHVANHIVLVPKVNYYNVALIAANDPSIANLQRAGRQAAFSFLSTAGLSNTVQYSDSLAPPVWKMLTNLLGDGTVKLIIDPDATNAARFYRVGF